MSFRKITGKSYIHFDSYGRWVQPVKHKEFDRNEYGEILVCGRQLHLPRELIGKRVRVKLELIG